MLNSEPVCGRILQAAMGLGKSDFQTKHNSITGHALSGGYSNRYTLRTPCCFSNLQASLHIHCTNLHQSRMISGCDGCGKLRSICRPATYYSLGKHLLTVHPPPYLRGMSVVYKPINFLYICADTYVTAVSLSVVTADSGHTGQVCHPPPLDCVRS